MPRRLRTGAGCIAGKGMRMVGTTGMQLPQTGEVRAVAGARAHKEGLPRMPRVDAVWLHPAFQCALRWVESLERDRAFCRHGAGHLMDTARIMWIMNLEQGLGLDREVVYATALLHDVGKAAQYSCGEPHEVVGARLAESILTGPSGVGSFSAAERGAIVGAIRAHRRLRPDAQPLERLLFQADKASRACFACPAEVREACSWPDAKKNLGIQV